MKLKIGVDVEKIKKDIAGAVKSASRMRLDVPVVGPLLSGVQTGIFGKPPEGATKKEQGTRSFGFGKALGKIAVGIGAAGVILKGIQTGIQVLSKASPKFGGMMKILERAMMLFFRPFGDFLATLLRPLAFWLLRVSRAWLKFTREFTIEKLGKVFEDVGKSISEGFDAVVVKPIQSFFQGAFDLGVWLGQNFRKFVLGYFNFGMWIAGNIRDFVTGFFNFGVWILDHISGFFTDDKFHFGTWLKDNIEKFVGGFWDIGTDIYNAIIKAINLIPGINLRPRVRSGLPNPLPGTAREDEDLRMSVIE